MECSRSTQQSNENLNEGPAAKTDLSSWLSGAGVAIPLFKVHMPEAAVVAAADTLRSGYIGQGPRVEEFEKQLGSTLQNANVVTVNSGTAALHLAMRLAGVTHGSSVVSTPMTCAATNMPILAMGADVIWADIDPWTGNIDALDVERKVRSNTRALVCVHWGGYPCDLSALNAIGRKYGIPVIEDAAHAFGSSYSGLPVGCHSDFVCFSFQAIKHLTTVDGGALLCRDAEMYRRAKRLRWFGIDREVEKKDFRCEEDIEEYGYKFHMNDVAASIGIQQLMVVEQVVAAHRANARYYQSELVDLNGLSLLRTTTDRESASWLFTIRAEDRSRFMIHMRSHGITVSQVHARNDFYTAFRPFRCNLPGVDEFTSEQVSIPVGWWLTDDDRLRIVKAVREFSESC